jgi:hypothetical protein
MGQILFNSLPTHAPEKPRVPAFFLLRRESRVALLAGSCRAALGLDSRGRLSLRNRSSGSLRFRL